MKKLHLICSKNPDFPALAFIKFTAKQTIVSNGFAVLALPTEDVMPNIVKDDETLYIRGVDWKGQKMYKAKSFIRSASGNIMALGKDGNALGVLQAVKYIGDSEYPDVLKLIPSEPSEVKYDKIAVNPEQFDDLCKAAGFTEARLTLAGYNKMAKVEFYRYDVLQENVLAGIMIFEDQHSKEATI